MFNKQRRSVPILSGISVGDMTLIDFKTLRGEQLSPRSAKAVARAWKKLQEYVTSQRPGTLVCDLDTSLQKRYYQDFYDYRVIHTGASTDDFDKVYDPGYDDTDVDRRLSSMTFAVRQDKRGIIGVFHLYNIRFLEETDRKITISAYASPSFETTRGYLNPEDLGNLMKALLERDMEEVDTGRIIDLKEWVFPTRDDQAWVERKGGSLTHLALAHLDSHVRSDIMKGQERIPTKIRRADDKG